MGESTGAILILDTSVLVNFLAIDRADLLARLGKPILITEHIVLEISEHYPDQQQRLQAALERDHLKVVKITDIPELETFAHLTSRKTSRRKRLGDGECSAIAVAHHRGYLLGIDDKPAINQISQLFPKISIRRTHELVVEIIRLGALTVAEADKIKADWAAHHRFHLHEFLSFGELL